MFGMEVSTSTGDGMSPLMIALIAVFAILLFGVIGRGLYVWIRNNRSPRQTAEAKVVTKTQPEQHIHRTARPGGELLPLCEL